LVAGGLRSTPGAAAGSLRRTGQRRLMEDGDGVASAGAAPHSELSSLRDKVGYVFLRITAWDDACPFHASALRPAS